MTCEQIRNRLIAGDDFILYHNKYSLGKPCHDGIYDYYIYDQQKRCAGAARFIKTDRVLLAFSFGRIELKLKEFEHVNRSNSEALTWYPAYS